MKTWQEAVQDYLALRRSLGFKPKSHHRYLEEFSPYFQRKDISRITC
jgi:hypothetical protein